MQVGPCIPVGIQLEKAEAGPTSGPTYWRLSHLAAHVAGGVAGPRVITPGQPGGLEVGSFHHIQFKFNGKRVGMLWNRGGHSRGAGRHPCPPES
jgi:hypothetical protein